MVHPLASSSLFGMMSVKRTESTFVLCHHFYSTRVQFYSITQRGSKCGHGVEEAKQTKLADGNDLSRNTLRNNT